MDKSIFSAINQLAGRYRLLDIMMIAISQKFRFLFILLFIFMWFRNRFYKKLALNSGISIVLTIITNSIIKLFYFRPRPFLNHLVHSLPPIPSKRNSSFPSKHTSLAFAAATFVFFYKRAIGFVMYLLALLSGFSRIWMGQHYPSDIVGSALLGSVISLLVKLSERVWNPLIETFIQRYHRFLDKMSNTFT